MVNYLDIKNIAYICNQSNSYSSLWLNTAPVMSFKSKYFYLYTYILTHQVSSVCKSVNKSIIAL